MATPPDHVAAVLALIATDAAWTTDTNLFRGQLRPVGTGVPQEAIFVRDTSGPEPIDFLAVQEWRPRAQVIYRGNRGVFGTTHATARTIYTLVHDILPAGYFECRAITPGPAPFSFTDNNQEEDIFAINLRLGVLQ